MALYLFSIINNTTGPGTEASWIISHFLTFDYSLPHAAAYWSYTQLLGNWRSGISPTNYICCGSKTDACQWGTCKLYLVGILWIYKLSYSQLHLQLSYKIKVGNFPIPSVYKETTFFNLRLCYCGLIFVIFNVLL